MPQPRASGIRAERARRAAALERERIAKDAERIRARCQTLAGFVREAWHVLEPRAKYTHGGHIDAICEHLEAVTGGRINRLLINVPPGSSKSLLVSVMWQAWEWGPRSLSSMRYLTTSFNDGPVMLSWRHEEMVEKGASWDHPEYQPHITISYDEEAPDLANVEPYQGEIVLGPEVFKEVFDDWLASVREV